MEYVNIRNREQPKSTLIYVDKMPDENQRIQDEDLHLYLFIYV